MGRLSLHCIKSKYNTPQQSASWEAGPAQEVGKVILKRPICFFYLILFFCSFYSVPEFWISKELVFDLGKAL
jgi:hypothetical protein